MFFKVMIPRGIHNFVLFVLQYLFPMQSLGINYKNLMTFGSLLFLYKHESK